MRMSQNFQKLLIVALEFLRLISSAHLLKMEDIDMHFPHDSNNDLENKIQSFKKPNGELREKLSMVLIRDSIPHNECSVFPPSNHENLHFPSHKNEEREDLPSPLLFSSSSSSSSFSPSDSDASELEPPQPLNTHVQKPHMASGLDMLLSKLFGFASLFVSNGGIRWKASSFSFGAGIFAGVVMLWSWYVRVRHRRVRENLKLIIREKDEKINKLLHQIAKLNEVLVDRHISLASKMTN